MRIIVSTSFNTLIGLLFLLNPTQAQHIRTNPDHYPVQAEETSAGNIIINEIMFDPEPSNGLPVAEYIELFNRSDKNMILDGWAVNGNKITELILAPFQYAIICYSDHVGMFQSYSNSIAGLKKWDNLNNTGQLITLNDQNDDNVDQVYYLPSMISDPVKRKGGWSLELVNPWQTCRGGSNWKESVGQTGGTPGSENSVFNIEPDIDPPEIVKLLWRNEDLLEITYSEPVEPNSATLHLNYTFSPDIEKAGISLDSQTSAKILIEFNNPVQTGKLYEILIADISDCSSNLLKDTSVFSGIGKMPEFSDILITELMIDEKPSAGLPESEYIEILNNSENLIDLEDLKFIREKDTINLVHRLLLSGEYLALVPEKNEALYQNQLNILGISPFPRLTNTSLTLALINTENRLISSVSYSDKWYRDLEKSTGGYSLEMVDISNPCGEDNNWRASDDPTGGTPGRQNSVSEQNPDLRSPAILDAVAITPDSLLIQLSERLHPQSPGLVSVEISGNIAVKNISSNFPDHDKLYIHLSETMRSRTEYNIVLQELEDCTGNPIDPQRNSITVQLPEKAESSDLVINEILFNPKPLGVDWIEIYNTSSKHLKLDKIGLGRLDDDKDLIKRIDSEIATLKPYDYMVITTDAGALTGDFPSSIPGKIIEIRQLPSLPDQAGSVVLYSENNDIIDFMEYTSNYHHPLLRNDEGVSLERISAAASSLIQSNWQSASATSGYGTPTRKNSSDNSLTVSHNLISIENELLSPDGDNYLDEMMINYNLSDPGYIANIEIYSLSGQKIVTLLSGKMIGVSGTISWNGRDERGSYVRPGHYIITMEIFNMKGDYFRIKEKCALVYPY